MSIFEFVKSKISILDVVLDYVQLKRAGGYWKGPCPFHQETDASFTVSPDKQIFYCFGCHAGGDLIAFVAKVENMAPYEAVCHLVEKYNLDVPAEIKGDFSGSKTSGQKDQFYHTCKSVEEWCHAQLLANSNAKKYLIQRDISEKEWTHFMVGYFPGGRIFLNRFLKDMSKKNVLAKDLVTAGVIAQGRHSMYSAFEERILFPIHDSLGRCCGFGGRVFARADERAKYYNSKESSWFLKGKLLFGLDLAKKEMQYAQKAFLVEGYTDCVAMAKHGYKNTVATLGTACTADHLKILSRFCKVLYVLYDGDSAGQKAILRLTKLCWEANLDLQIITLPSNLDPASFLDGGGDLKNLIEQSSDIFTFFVNSLGGQFWGKQLSEKVELCDKIIDVISRIDDSSIKKDLLLQRAATVMQVPFTSLKDMVERKRSHESVVDPGQDEKDSGPSLDEQIACLVINSVMTENMLFVDTDLLPYFSQRVREILIKSEEFFKANGEKSWTFDNFLQSFSDHDRRDWVISRSFVLDSDDPDTLLEKLQFRFRKKNWKQIVRDMKKQIFAAKQENNKDKLQGLLTSFLLLKQEMKQRGLI